MRLIDADALRGKAIQFFDDGKHGRLNGLREAWTDSIDIPTIDPVKHGKWIFKGTSTDGKKVYECSACHADIYATGNFCKECGARMDGEV